MLFDPLAEEPVAVADLGVGVQRRACGQLPGGGFEPGLVGVVGSGGVVASGLGRIFAEIAADLLGREHLMGVIAALAVGDLLDVELPAEREHPFGILEVDPRHAQPDMAGCRSSLPRAGGRRLLGG